jgi:hypothetical protein
MSLILAIGAALGAKGRWQGVAGLAAGLAAVAALGGLLWLIASMIMASHDKRVIAQDRAESGVVLLNETIAADRGAGAAQAERDRRTGAATHSTMEAINAAAADDDGDPLRAGLDGLRRKDGAARGDRAARPREARDVPDRR